MSAWAPDDDKASDGVRSETDIADLVSESVIVFDTAGKIRYWNPASEALYGWPALTMMGRTIGHLAALMHQGVSER